MKRFYNDDRDIPRQDSRYKIPRAANADFNEKARTNIYGVRC